MVNAQLTYLVKWIWNTFAQGKQIGTEKRDIMTYSGELCFGLNGFPLVGESFKFIV